MAIELTYGEVEATLADLNRIADEKRIAFKARLKHFQRLGFPEGANTGTGKRVVYTIPMLFKLVLAVELTQVGMPPKLISEVIERNWPFLAESLIENLERIVSENEEMASFHWAVKADALIELKRKPESQDTFGVMSAFPVESVNAWIADRRNVILNGPLLVSDVLGALKKVDLPTTGQSVIEDLKDSQKLEFKRPRNAALLGAMKDYFIRNNYSFLDSDDGNP